MNNESGPKPIDDISKPVESAPTESDFARWDQLMRQRLLVRMEAYLDQAYSDDPNGAEMRKDYDEEMDTLRDGLPVPRKQPVFDMFSTEFGQMVRDGEARFGPDMEYYFEFQKRFFQ